ncbi:MAG: hypothetical protein GY730_07525 [bacterium]|nr:hypothetical protein [bacterium]
MPAEIGTTLPLRPLNNKLKKHTKSELPKKNTNQEKRNISSNQTTGGDPSGFDKSSFHTLHISQNNTNNVVVDNNSPSSTKTDNNNVSINTTPTKKVATQKKVVAPQIKQLLQLRQDLKNDISDIASLKNNADLLLVTDIMTFGTVVPIKINLATSGQNSTIYQKALAITSVVCNTGTIVSSVVSMAFPPAAFVTAGFAFASIFTDAAMFVNTVKNLNTASNANPGANPGMKKSYTKAIQKHAITLLGNTAKNLLFCIPGVAAGVAAGSAALGFAATLTLPSFITAKSILITAGVSKVFTTVPVLRKSLKNVVRRLGLKNKVKKNIKKEKILAAAVTAQANADNGFQKLTSQPKKKQKVYIPKMFSKKIRNR